MCINHSVVCSITQSLSRSIGQSVIRSPYHSIRQSFVRSVARSLARSLARFAAHVSFAVLEKISVRFGRQRISTNDKSSPVRNSISEPKVERLANLSAPELLLVCLLLLSSRFAKNATEPVLRMIFCLLSAKLIKLP